VVNIFGEKSAEREKNAIPSSCCAHFKLSAAMGGGAHELFGIAFHMLFVIKK
jgi:hypothetical protein